MVACHRCCVRLARVRLGDFPFAVSRRLMPLAMKPTGRDKVGAVGVSQSHRVATDNPRRATGVQRGRIGKPRATREPCASPGPFNSAM